MKNASTDNNTTIARLFESLQNPKKRRASLSQEVGKHFAWHGPNHLSPALLPMNGALRFGCPLLMHFLDCHEKLICCLAELAMARPIKVPTENHG